MTTMTDGYLYDQAMSHLGHDTEPYDTTEVAHDDPKLTHVWDPDIFWNLLLERYRCHTCRVIYPYCFSYSYDES